VVTFVVLQSAVRENQLKIAAGSCCESCGEYYPPGELELHPISSIPDPDACNADEILVLCTWCHNRLHEAAIPEELQRSAVRLRPPGISRRMHEILKKPPAGSHEPPESGDPAEIFADSLRPGPIDLILNGA